jgi:hypothetical protein
MDRTGDPQRQFIDSERRTADFGEAAVHAVSRLRGCQFQLEAERDHLRVGDHAVRVLTMKESITETRPLDLCS